jgi:DNA-binding NarL/FixJ family response regulator
MDHKKTPREGIPPESGLPAKPARILVVDDHPMIRKAICAAIEVQPDMTCCGEAASAKEALAMIEQAGADLAVVDISMPACDGIELIRALKARWPALLVLVFSMHDENRYAERALHAGASGYVMKEDTPERFILGLRTVLKGQLFVSQRVLTAMLNGVGKNPRRPAGPNGMEWLSRREIQVFEEVGRGLSTAAIAQRYDISAKTVDTHRSHVKHKLGLATAADLIHAAIRWVDRSTGSNETRV